MSGADTTDPPPRSEIRFPWEMRTRLKGNARKQAAVYLQSLSNACYFCKLPLGYGTPDLHHIDENPANNVLSNLSLAHHGCNSSDYNKRKARTPPSSSTPPRESATAATSSDALARHLIQRPAWNLLLYREPRRPEEPTLFTEEGGRIPFRATCLKAPDLIGSLLFSLGKTESAEPCGSSKTYALYLEEDIAAGYFFPVEDGKIERTAKPFPLSKRSKSLDEALVRSTVMEHRT